MSTRFRLQVFKRKDDGRWIPVVGRSFHAEKAAMAMAESMHEGWKLALPEPGATLIAMMYRLYLPNKPGSKFLKISTRRKTAWQPVRDAGNQLNTPPGVPAVWESTHVH